MLNTKLQEEKRINKKKKATAKKLKKGKEEPKKEIKRGKSKFSNKYSERIASIREADEKAKNKMLREKNKKKNNKNVVTKNNIIAKDEQRNINHKAKNPKTKKKTREELKEELLRNLEK